MKISKIFNVSRKYLSQNPRIISREKENKFWSNYLRSYDILNEAIPYQRYWEDLITKINPQPQQLILDAGCGTGTLAIILRKYGSKIYGLDINSVALEVLREKNKEIYLIEADISNLPFKGNTFDAVTSNNVIYLLEPKKREEALKEIHRTTKIGGKVVITVPKKSFNPFKIYIEHITSEISQKGWMKTFFHLSKLLLPTIKILYYGLRIRMKAEKDFFTKEEFWTLLNKNGLEPNEIIDTCANQYLTAVINYS